MKQKILTFFVVPFISLGIAQAQSLPDNVVNINCYVAPPATQWSIKEVNLNNNVLIQNYGPLAVGDIDGDSEGIVEIIGYKEDTRNSNNYESNGLKIFYYDQTAGQLVLKNEFLFATTGGSTSATFGSMAIARYNNTGHIVVAGTDKYLYAYNPAGGRIWKSNAQYHTGGVGTTLGIVDFNGDGIPEVYTGNQVFSLSTGALLCDGGTTNSSGVLVSATGHYTVAADMDGDNKPEIVAGTDIYKVTITNNSGTAGNSIALISDMRLQVTLPTYALKDGATQVVDIDNDGQLEVVVTSLATSTEAADRRAVVYVWKPLANNQSYIMGSYLIPANNVTYYSIPMIGNIDSTIYPEIVFITNGSAFYMYALKYDPAAATGSQISLKWNLTHTDGSGCTGASLFDFNQDGRNEIVYRDETTLRIIDGSNNPGANANEIRATFTDVRSGTLREFPIIADVDADGQAEILVTGWDNVANSIGGVAASSQNGYLRLFKTGGSAWAPARKVWNQYAYNAINVNEDLTIPAVQFNMATQFLGYDGLPNTGDEVRPFNSFQEQQTTISQDGVPLWSAPEAEIVGTPVFSYNETSGEMAVSVQVKNSGDAAFHSPFYITVYKDNVGNATKYTHTYNEVIGINETVTMTFTILNFLSWTPNNSIFVKLNDNGNGVDDQTVCDDSQSRYRYYGLLPTEQVVCLGKPQIITCSFTLGTNDTYQWQSSKDNFVWNNIQGATTISYDPVNQKRGITFYRVIVTNGTEKENSVPIMVRVKSCQIPVNHNIGVMGYD